MAGRSTSAAAAEPGAAPRTRRSRITPEREAEVFGAVLDLLREVGYEALTMDAVATRTRCSKATLYRQWVGKPELVAVAVRQDKAAASPSDIDTGTLRGDFHAMADQIGDGRMQRNTELMRGLVHAAHSHPDLLKALRELFIDPELNGFNAMMRRAVERGEIPADTPALAYLPHMLVGALITRPLIEDLLVDRAFFVDYVDSALLPSLGVEVSAT
ncbi:TetR/AcrR family transcriptional regulator [Streptomyces sp. 2A115]|uniref:TetR/AcrR family transcriptional regulator n=1 Tax=Streptomyces sp. 2A115 TaxID=3457439 RepID=UPI003FD50B3D